VANRGRPLNADLTRRQNHLSFTTSSPQQSKSTSAFSTMPPLTSHAFRTCARQQLPVLRASSVISVQQQRRGKANIANPTASFDSPFRGLGASPTTKIPDFSHYKSSRGQDSNKVFSYFMAGTLGVLSAAGAKATVQGGWSSDWQDQLIAYRPSM
jgi:Ubiquinol cytochrome reductase transmembrane region